MGVAHPAAELALHSPCTRPALGPHSVRRSPRTNPNPNPNPNPNQVAAESSDYSNVPIREGIEEQDRYERSLMNAAGNDGGVTYMQKPSTGKGKAKAAPTGSVAEDLGY